MRQAIDQDGLDARHLECMNRRDIIVGRKRRRQLKHIETARYQVGVQVRTAMLSIDDANTSTQTRCDQESGVTFAAAGRAGNTETQLGTLLRSRTNFEFHCAHNPVTPLL